MPVELIPGQRGLEAAFGASHTTWLSADGRTMITIGCHEQCCKNTEDGPVLVEGMKCHEHNTEYLR